MSGATSASRSAEPAGWRSRIPAPWVQAWEDGHAQAMQQWRALQPKERRAATVAAFGLALVLLWWVLLAPAFKTLREAPKALQALESQLQQMRSMAAEAAELRRQPVIGSSQAGSVLQAATERLGAKARLEIQGDQVTLVVQDVGTESLQSWLAEARSGARALPVAAELSRSGEGYSGTLTLTLPGSP